MRHKFNGIVYDIDPVEAEAYCVSPNGGVPQILFAGGIKSTKASLITQVHEALHACKWGMPEDDVDRAASDIGSFLWKIGWRLEGSKPRQNRK